MMEGEEALVARHPTMQPAYARMIVGAIPIAVAAVLFAFTNVPYVYPFVALVVGLFIFFRGVVRYWMNHHTAYYVKNRSAMHLYGFAWLHTTEIPVSRIISISEASSLCEMITGRGNVIVGSGFGQARASAWTTWTIPGPWPKPSGG